MNTPINNGIKVSVSAAVALILTTLVATAVERSSTGSPYLATNDASVAMVIPLGAIQAAPRA